MKAAPTAAVLSKWVLTLESTLTDRFPGQPDVEDVEDAEVFLFECADSTSLSLSLPLPFSSHSFQLKTTKILGIKYFSKFKGFFTVLTGQVCSFVFNPCPTSSATCLFNFYNVHI